MDVAREGALGLERLRALIWLDQEPNLPASGVGCKFVLWFWIETGRDGTGEIKGEAADIRARLRWYDDGACDELESFWLRLLSGIANVARCVSFFCSGGVVSMSSALRFPWVLSLRLRLAGVGVLGSMVFERERRADVGVMVEGGRRN